MLSLLLLLLGAGECAGCHEGVTADFAQSRHAQARRLPVFALSFPHAQTRWCLSCHQPEGSGDGHTCLTCHRAEGAVQSARKKHPVIAAPGVATKACARCHEFTSPLPGHLSPVVLSNEPLQSTVSEQRAAMPGATCVTCHDPHRAPGAHDPAMLAKGVTVRAEPSDGGVTFEVQVGRTGHRFPTGDPFRRLVLMTCRDEQCTEPIARKVFQRNMGLVDGGVWSTVRDTTLASGESRTVTLASGPWWSARYYFGDPRFEPELPADEVFVGVGR